MKVKPGCLAYIVRPWMDDETLGLTVKVIRLDIHGETTVMKNGEISSATGPGDLHGWLVDASHPAFPCFVANICLRPWEDPGDDATDEMIQRLGSPNKQKEHA